MNKKNITTAKDQALLDIKQHLVSTGKFNTKDAASVTHLNTKETARMNAELGV